MAGGYVSTWAASRRSAHRGPAEFARRIIALDIEIYRRPVVLIDKATTRLLIRQANEAMAAAAI